MSQNSEQAITADRDMVSLPIDTVSSSLHDSGFNPTVQQSNLSSLVHGGGARGAIGFGVGGGVGAFVDFDEVLLLDFVEGIEVLLLDFAEGGVGGVGVGGVGVGGVGVGGVGVGGVGGDGGGGQSTLQPDDGSHPYQSSLPDQEDFPLLDQPSQLS